MRNLTPQKIVQLCTLDSGGAGKAALRINSGLRSIGVDSTMIVALKQSNDPAVTVLGSGDFGTVRETNVEYDKDLSTLTGHWSMLAAGHPNRPQGQEMFSDTTAFYRLENAEKIKTADIIHFHWVTGFFDYLRAVPLLKGKKLVWTLHDMNPFTGGCHYAGDCNKYHCSCGDCPQLGSSLEKDLSRHVWEQKKQAYRELDITVVTPSRWMAACASASSLFEGVRVTVIPNGVPVETFRPLSRTGIRKGLNIPEEAKVILFGADHLMNRRKGLVLLLKTLQDYRPKLAHCPVYFAVFGKSEPGLTISSDYPVLDFGSLTNEQEIASLYNLADVFVLPSLEDNLPNTVLEAMACGTPVVGFDTGGIPDMISHKVNGFLARPRDIASLAEGIGWCLSSSDRNRIARVCRESVLARYSVPAQSAAYETLYNELHSARLLIEHRDKSAITIATSIAPKDIEKQQAAIQTWLTNGFKVVSVNTGREIAILKPDFPKITFVETKRDARESLGRPLIYLDDVLAALKSSSSHICGIINSDIHLRYDIPIYDFVASEAKDSFICGHRYDVENLFTTPGTLYLNGYDIFFFDKSVLDRLPLSPFCLGATWWDMWVPLALILKSVTAKRIIAPLGYHVRHENRWDGKDWLLNCAKLVKLIDSNQFDLSGYPDFVARIESLDDRRMPHGLYKLFRDFIIEHSQLVAPKQMLPEGIDPALQHPSYLVSAIVSTYNAENFFSDCICNLIGQSLFEKGLLEIIIINSGSEQNEERIAQYYMETHDHIVYQRTGRETLYAAWNRGIKLSRGKYITHANTDDRHHPNTFEIMAQTLDQHDVGLVYVDALMTRGTNENFKRHSAEKAWLLPDFNIRQAIFDCPFGCQVMWRHSAHADVGMFDGSYKRAGDYEFFLRLALKSGALHLPKILTLYHESPDNLSYQAPEEVIQEVNRFIGPYRRQLPLESIYPYLQKDASPAAQAAALVDFANNLMGSNGFLFKDTLLAEALYRQALEILPRDQDIIGNLIIACLINGTRIDAISLIQSANRLTPRLAYCRDALLHNKKPMFTLTRIDYPGLSAMQAIKTARDIRVPWDRSMAGDVKKSIIIDGLIFQLQHGRTFGISRLWWSLLTELAATPLAGRMVLLDREGTAPEIPGIRRRKMLTFCPGNARNEASMLDQICREEGGGLFVSTYYTYTLSTPSLLMLYDMIPERYQTVGPDAPNPEWRDKYHAIVNASSFAAISQSTARDLEKFYPQAASRPQKVIPCAVSDAFRAHSTDEIAAFKAARGLSKRYFLLVGRRDAHKNVRLFFQAFARLPEREQYAIVMAGAGHELEPELRDLIAGTDSFAGFFSDQDLALLYSGAVALVYPSIYEGFGLPILEAMQSGCPVITCHNSSIFEVAGRAALYVGECDVDGLSKTLLDVQQPDVRGYLIKAGLEQAQRFSWKKSAVLLAATINAQL